MSEADQEKLLAELRTASTPSQRRDRVVFALMLGSGLRLGSAIGLRVEDVDLEAREIRVVVAKGGREYVAYLSDELATLLAEWIGERREGLLFAGPEGAPLVPRLVRRRLSWWLRRAGCRDASPHALRHAFGQRVYERSGDVFVVREALGHASVESTGVYARVSPRRVRLAHGMRAANV